MSQTVLLDTGPLISFLGADLENHGWVCAQWKLLRPPLWTCEPVLTEAAFLLKREGREADGLFELLERGVIRVGLQVQEHHTDLRALLHRYRDQPISLADACLVRLAELHAEGMVFTFDTDFRFYRKHGRQQIPLLLPDT